MSDPPQYRTSKDICISILTLGFFGSLAIGLTTMITNCNPGIPGGCLVSEVVEVTIEENTIHSGQCCQYLSERIDGSYCRDVDYSCCYSVIRMRSGKKSCIHTTEVKKDCSYELGVIFDTIMDNPQAGYCPLSIDDSRNSWIIGFIVVSLDCVIASVLLYHYGLILILDVLKSLGVISRPIGESGEGIPEGNIIHGEESTIQGEEGEDSQSRVEESIPDEHE